MTEQAALPAPKGVKSRVNRERALVNRARAMDLRKAGLSYVQIGAQIGVSDVQAFRYVKTELERLSKKSSEDAEAVRQLEIERLNQLLLGLWGRATGGDVHAVDRVLRIMDRRSRYMGLDQQTGGQADEGDVLPAALHTSVVIVAPAEPESIEEWAQRYTPAADAP